jgi:hypothetical protein
METNKIVMTEFNSNLATLQRIDNELRRASYAQSTDDYDMWFKCLRTLMKEVYVKMNTEQKEESLKWFKKLETKVGIYFKSPAMKNSYMCRIDNELDMFELFLREIMDSRGMLLRNNEPDLSGI